MKRNLLLARQGDCGYAYRRPRLARRTDPGFLHRVSKRGDERPGDNRPIEGVETPLDRPLLARELGRRPMHEMK